MCDMFGVVHTVSVAFIVAEMKNRRLPAHADSRLCNLFYDFNNYEYLNICPGRMRIRLLIWLSLHSCSIVVPRFLAIELSVSPR